MTDPLAPTAAARWGYGRDAVVTELCVSENATHLVREPGRPDAVLRLHRPGYHRRTELESELVWSQALRADGVCRTPRAWPGIDGERVQDVGGRYATLFDFVPGEPPAPDHPAGGMRAIGALAARLHAHARAFRRPPGFTRFRWDLTAALGSGDGPGRWGSWRRAARELRAAELALLGQAESRVREQLTRYGSAPDRFGLVHADLRAANLLVSGDDVTVLDFDDCGLSWFGYDLAASVSFLEHTAELPGLVADWLAGYTAAGCGGLDDGSGPCPGPPLAALIMLRRLQLLAWSATHADTGMVRSLGAGFAQATAHVAERYLAGRLLPDQRW